MEHLYELKFICCNYQQLFNKCFNASFVANINLHSHENNVILIAPTIESKIFGLNWPAT